MLLLTNGCSFVWGDELDGWDNEPPTHWPLTFTHLLSEKMGCEYVNLGTCGGGNDKIFRDTINYLIDPNKETPTHMVLIWSAFQRAEVVEYIPDHYMVENNIKRWDDCTQFSPMRNGNIYSKDKRLTFKKYNDEAYDSRTDILHTISKMQAIQIICDNLGIKLIQGAFHHRMWVNIMAVLQDLNDKDSYDPDRVIPELTQYKEKLTWMISTLPRTSRVGLGTRFKDLYSMAKSLGDIKEYGHPGEKTQEVFADMLYEMFTKELN